MTKETRNSQLRAILQPLVLIFFILGLVYLTFLNFDEKLWGSVASVLLGWVVTVLLLSLGGPEKSQMRTFMSVLLGGTCTLVVAVAGTLRESRDQRAFAAPIVVDSRNNLPYFVVAREPRENVRQMDLSSLAHRQYQPGKLAADPPQSNDKDRDSYYLELLEYALLNRIQSRGAQGRGVSKMWGGKGPGIFLATVDNSFKLSESVRIPSSDFVKGITDNRFFERLEYPSNGWFFPPGTRVYTQHSPQTQTQIETRRIFLVKPQFFKVEIEITALGSSYDNGFIPPNFQVSDRDLKFVSTRVYSVTMKTVFEKWAAGNRYSQEYKSWVKWLLDDLQTHFGQ